MKRKLLLTIIACGTSLALCPALLAQDASPAASTAGGGQQGGRRGGGGMSIDRLTTALTLTPDEVTKITPILSDFRTQVQTIRADTSLSQTDRMSKMKDARDTMTAAVNAILTPDQQTKFAAMQSKMRGRRGGGGGGGGADASPAASATP
jgi:Spy/CpxP family protein refolding chaperone